MTKSVIIDDDPVTTRLIGEAVKAEDHQYQIAHTLAEGLGLARQDPPDLIFLDISLPDGSGMDLLGTFLGLSSEPEVIVISGSGDEKSVETAIYLGAWDYVQKPVSRGALRHMIRQALRYRQDKAGRTRLVALKRPGMVGDSPALHRCLQEVAKAASSAAPCLIHGETGVGKELAARIIHENSTRCEGPFVIVDCAALQESLINSTLFGHVKGAFTGANTDKKGLVEIADKGVLFLDEIGELPMSAQKNLLRVLQEQTFLPVGAAREKKSDFRLVSATNRDLAAMADQQLFRQDLLHRIMGQEIFMPPLRERPEDLPQLTAHFLQNICETYGLPTKGNSPDFLPTLKNYTWPGNIREFGHCMENAVVNAGAEPILYPQHLPSYVRIRIRSGELDKPDNAPQVTEAVETGEAGEADMTLKEARQEGARRAEKRYLERLLADGEKNVHQLCERAGVSKPHFYDLLRRHGLESPGKKKF